MPPKNSIVCPSCGSKNALANHRCVACGARVDTGERSRARQQELARRYQRDGFSFSWFLISLLVVGVLTVAVIFGVPMAFPVFDFEGYAGAMVSVAVWFVGGLLVGLISPGKTFAEPVLAALIVAVPTAFVLFQGQTVKVWPAFMYGLMAAVGVAFALIGAYVGERTQMGPPARQ